METPSLRWTCWIGPDERPRWIGNAVATSTGYRPEDLLQSEDLLKRLVHRDDFGLVTARAAKARAGALVPKFPVRLVTETGTIVPGIAWFDRVVDAAGEPRGLCLTMEHRPALYVSAKSSGGPQLVAGPGQGPSTSHERNNLLTVILAHAELAQMDGRAAGHSDDIDRYLTRITEAAVRLWELSATRSA